MSRSGASGTHRGPPSDIGARRVQERVRVVSIGVDVTSLRDASDRVLSARASGEHGYVCVANVHMVMEAYDDPSFAKVVDEAILVVPDGMPLVWMSRALGAAAASRVRGPDLVIELARRAAADGVPIALFGGSPDVASGFAAALQRHAPALDVPCVISPPYRELSDEEEQAFIDRLNASGAGIVYVGLGCPKQERWMARMAGRIDAVAIGVGAAFDFHAGSVPEAPRWMQRAGLEWSFRLAQEPRRLWRRYALHNPRFVALAARQILATAWSRFRHGE